MFRDSPSDQIVRALILLVPGEASKNSFQNGQFQLEILKIELSIEENIEFECYNTQ